MTGTGIGRRSFLTASAAAGLTIAHPALLRPAAAQQPSTWDQIRDSGKLRFGLVPNRAPYQYVENGRVKGFIATMADDLAATLGRHMQRPITVDYVQTTLQTTILDMQANKIDCYIPMTVSEERRKAVDMVEPLYMMPVVAFNRRGFNPGTNWADYDKPGIRVAVAMGTTDEATTRANLKSATIRAFKTNGESILDVQSGNADATIMGLLIGLLGTKKNSNLGDITMLQPINAPPSGGATRKDGDGRFTRLFQEWANDIHGSGRVTQAILAAMKESDLDVEKLPAGVRF